MHARRASIVWFGTACTFALIACGDDTPNLATPGPDPESPPSASSICSIPDELIVSGGPPPDGIPALLNPDLLDKDHPDNGYLLDDDRVIGLELDGMVIAVPHNIGWVHEIVNLEVNGRPIAITHCPLTGSSLAFDRGPADGVRFGVSGFLYQNNLVMFDDQGSGQEASLWPQMSRGARCGVRDGTALPMIPIVEMTWAGWRSLHPETQVIAGTFGPSDYHQSGYPYGGNLDLNSAPWFNGDRFFIRAIDRRRPLKERVLGVSDDEGGIAFPFGELDALGPAAAVRSTLADGSPFIVLWDREYQAAMAYRPVVGGDPLTLEVQDGVIVDVETGSTWEVDGRARSGPLEGKQLEPVAEAYMAFWFAWAAFQPSAQIWSEDAV